MRVSEAGAILQFRDGPHGPAPAAIQRAGADIAVPVAESDFFVVIGGRLVAQGDLAFIAGGDGEARFRCDVAEVAWRWRAGPASSELRLSVTALQDGLLLDQAGLWRARLAGPVRLGRGRRVPPADLLAPVAGVLEAHPIWIGDDLFAGIDWPVAENACAPEGEGGEGRVLFREFPGVELARGQTWVSHSLSIGAAEPGRQAEAFAAHLGRLRARPTRRASFYFDWLTHASEGPTEAETAAMVDLLGRLRARDGVVFDIYALDDGAVETRWSLHWDRYRLQHRRRFPGGLTPLTRRLAALGTDLGVWIGPDGFGGDGRQPRAADVAGMVRDWNVSLLKIDTCVSVPWREGEPQVNDAYLRRFQAMLSACRAERADLVAVNHRVTGSPYVLTMLDSTLWEGAESYPDVFLNNADRPRLHTRYAAYGRGLPTYYGAPSDLLEDHGVCFNGDPDGWRREVCVGAFGRALALSPEIYGTLFLLPDADYRDLGLGLALAKEWRPVLATPGRRTDEGDFVHADPGGTAAVVCLLNDAWTPAVRVLRVDEGLGLRRAAGEARYSVLARFPDRRAVAVDVPWGGTALVALAPFEALAVEVVPGAPEGVWTDVPHRLERDALILSGPPGAERDVRVWRPGEAPGAVRRVRFPGRVRREPDWVDLGALEEGPAGAGDAEAAEACRFAISNDPAEWQVLEAAAPTGVAEVAACRDFFREKLRREGMGVAQSAWDGDPLTAWGDAPHWARLPGNLWRLDLGDAALVAALEIDLADFGGGPVFQGGGRQGLEGPVWVEASSDLRTWSRAEAHVFYTRNAMRTWPSALIAEFPAGTAARYLRVRARGFAVRHIRVLAQGAGGALRPLCPDGWRGTNLFGDAPPQTVYRGRLRVEDTWPGRTLAVVVDLPERVPLQQEACLCWAEVGGRVVPAVAGSPRPLFHSWEHDSGGAGPGFVWRLPVGEGWVGREVRVGVAWLGARARDGRAVAAVGARAYLLSDGSPLAEARLPL